MESDKKIIGKCPLCGGDVVKTQKGWACVNSLSDNPQCQFFLFSTIGNRRISDNEATDLLMKGKIILDGFSTKEGKCFTSILNFNPDGAVNMSSQIGTCPKCGGILYVGSKAVSCSNFRHPESPCNFTIWRNIGGHDLSLAEIEGIINNGTTEDAVTLYDNKGNVSNQKIGLNSGKDVVRL